MAKSRFLKNLYKRYIVVIYNESNLQERASLSLTPLNLFLVLSTMVAFSFIAAALLIAFTPLKETITLLNNSTTIAPSDYARLQSRVDSLEKVLDMEHKQEERFRKLLNGDTTASIMNYELRIKNREQASPFHFASLISNEASSRSLAYSPSHILLFPPVTGYISQHFMPTEGHFGVDLVTVPEAPVKAVADGYVVFAEWSAETGNVIILQHANNLLSVYKHNASLSKHTGDFVKAGDVIALVGNTGENTTGPHLHFELWKQGQPMDPESVILFR